MKGFLFYSNSCQHCINLMKIMDDQKMLQQMTILCVDKMSDVELIKYEINYVPTILIINNVNGDIKKGKYEDKKAFEWVNAVIENRKRNLMTQVANQQRIIKTAEMKKNFKDGIYEYSQHETNGISDAYAYYNVDINKDIDVAQPKSFQPYGKDENYRILTVQDADKNKISVDVQNSLTTSLMKSREQQDKELYASMEKQIISAVINPELQNI